LIGAGINTTVGNNGGAVAIRTKLFNFHGRGERFNVEYQYGTKRTAGVSVRFKKPLAPWTMLTPFLTTSVFQYGSDLPWSGFREIDRGTLIDLSFRPKDYIDHHISWEGIWRDIACIPPSTAFEVREESGHTLKSSIKHILKFDTRDNPMIPREGSLVKLQQEYAGLGGNVGFHKHELEVQQNLPLIGDLTIQGTFKAGFMRPTQKENSVTCITDRFFIGGPLNLRGFRMYGVGPHSDGNALGANTYWLGGLHLYSPLPFISKESIIFDFFRTHLFMNVGNIGNFSFTKDHYKNLKILQSCFRLSFGVGLVISLNNFARFELHYAVPYFRQPGDKPEKGLQFGFDVNFV